MELYLIGGSIFGSFLGLSLFSRAIRDQIAHVNFVRAAACIEAGNWGLLESNINLRSYWWRFAGRNYILLVGLIARRRISGLAPAAWIEILAKDRVLEQDICRLLEADSAAIAGYLQSKVLDDTGLWSGRRISWGYFGGAILLAGNLSLLIYEIAGSR